MYPRDPQATYHAPDSAPVVDAMRPVTQIARDSFTLQYVTATPSPTLVEVREGEIPAAAFIGKGKRFEPWPVVAVRPDGRIQTDPLALPGGDPKVRFVLGSSKPLTLHTLRISGLKPGKRYFYRIYDPGAEPTTTERRWGASKPWRREFAVSTLAPKGRRTVIRIPVKVLLMPNVVNVESAYADAANPAPMPPRMTEADLQKLREEYAVSAREFFVASGMRLWIDYQIFVDDRWQRWGPEPAAATGHYKGLMPSRSYAGKDFDPPGGGTWTILDTKDPLRVTNEPVVEAKPYSAQIEQAFPRKWNAATKNWEFYTSGGGTFGIDGFPDGVPARSQYLGGSDTAWLATHEFHHSLESHGTFALSDREDDRIAFDHPAPRRRVVRPDGSVEENTWTTNGRHGEHWDVVSFWDRQITDAQWLRMYFGYTETVKDADEDGFPDDDARLPFDERRFGSSPRKAMTDGFLNDLKKVMLSTWVPGPLQSTWIKPAFQGVKPNPTNPDTDGDGLIDRDDPYPLYPQAPLIVPKHATIDGDVSEWKDVPEAGSFDKGGIRFTYKQAHDDAGYYGYYEVRGPWKRIDVTLDGEGKGVYSGEGVLGFQTFNESGNPSPGPKRGLVSTKPSFGGAPGLKIEATPLPDGGMGIEFRLPNRGEGPWFWYRGGQEIGAIISVWDDQGRGYSAWEPYRAFYARMVEPNGQVPMPQRAPSEIQAGEAGVTVYRPGDPALKAEGGWKLENGAYRHSGDESALVVGGLKATDFDLLAVIEAKGDGILGAFTKQNQMNAGQGYIGFVGGYGNAVTRLRLFGSERGDARVVMTPGKHTIQLTRRDGEVWLLLDGKPAVFATDPNSKAVVDRLAVLGGYAGGQIVHEIRIRQ